jgi:hypothetical protein
MRTIDPEGLPSMWRLQEEKVLVTCAVERRNDILLKATYCIQSASMLSFIQPA